MIGEKRFFGRWGIGIKFPTCEYKETKCDAICDYTMLVIGGIELIISHT